MALYNQLGINSFYPEANYKEDNERSLCFLIAHDETTKRIIQYLKKKYLKNFPGMINYQDPSARKLTALHLAVIKEQKDLIGELLKLGADPNIQDVEGWTPYYLTTLIDKNAKLITEIFEKYGVKKDLKTKANDTYRDLLIQTGRIPQKWGMKKTFIEEREKLFPLRVKNLSSVGLSSYTDSILFTRKTFSYLWKKKEVEKNDDYNEMFENLPTTAPKLIIARDEEITKLIGRTCLGLKAGQDIAFGSAICMFGGTITPERQTLFFNDIQNDTVSDQYDISFLEEMAIQPYTNGNAARFINDGFPNVIFRHISGKGLIGLAMCEIKNGDFLFFNYQNSQRLKWLGSVLKNKESLITFFKQKPLIELIKYFEVDPKTLNQKDRFKNLCDRTLIAYPISTPSAILYLSLTNTVTAADWFDILDSKFFVVVKQILDGEVSLCWTLSLLGELQKFEGWLKKISSSDPNDVEAIRSFLISILDTTDVPKILYSLQLFQEYYILSQTKMDSIFDKIKEKIKDYDWEKSSPVILPRYDVDPSRLVILPQFQKLYKKYGII